MHICILYNGVIPVLKYGGIQRIAVWLGKELNKRGHKITYLVAIGSTSDFADVKFYNPDEPLEKQIPHDVDVVHSFIPIDEPLTKPYLINMESNITRAEHDINTVFVSKKHAERHGAECFVYNGLDPDDYGKPDFSKKKKYLHFLGKAAWRVKNIKGSIKIAQMAKRHLHVLGGTRLNFHMGFRLTLDPKMHFHGMIGGEKKNEIINNSAGLLFPVVWHEPFGIAITESMYFGCPVFGTPYGSLPEIVDEKSGFLSNNANQLAEAVKHAEDFDRQYIHDRVMEHFSIKQMADKFLALYEKLLNGETLNKKKPVFPVNEPKFLEFNY